MYISFEKRGTVVCVGGDWRRGGKGGGMFCFTGGGVGKIFMLKNKKNTCHLF